MARNLTYEGLLEKVNSFDEYGEYIVKHLDEALWLQTIKTNTKEAYENYLKIFPKGLYLRGANYRIDNFMVQEKQDKDKMERGLRLEKEKELQHQKKIEEQENKAKEERLKQEKIREEKLKQEAIEKDHQSFKTAQKLNNEFSYSDYLTIYPYGLHKAEALRKIDEFVKIKQEKAKEERLKQEKIREEKLKQEAIEKDHQSFKTAQKLNNELSYSDYLKNYPYGFHKAEALRKIDEFVKIKQDKGKIERELRLQKEKAKIIIKDNLMINNIRIFDIGGSGVKTAKINLNSYAKYILDNEITHYPNPDWNDFVPWLNNNKLLDCNVIGISSAGFIENNRNIKLCSIANWTNKQIVNEIKAYNPSIKVFLLNDAEAHLMAHEQIFPGSFSLVEEPINESWGIFPFPAPYMSLSLGTSVGFAMSNKNGMIFRPPDNMNFDIGALKIPTRAKNNEVWWALGSHGLQELENNLGKEQGVIQYGYRLGAFLLNICGIFRPKTVILSGGIIENNWDKFRFPIHNEFEHGKPDWLEFPEIVQSPFGKNAGLIGITNYVIKNLNSKK
jgi:hypothetical protein